MRGRTERPHRSDSCGTENKTAPESGKISVPPFSCINFYAILLNNVSLELWMRIKESQYDEVGGPVMKHIKTLTTRDLKESMKKGGCGECQTSCQSACKTSCTVGNQSCEQVQK